MQAHNFTPRRVRARTRKAPEPLSFEDALGAFVAQLRANGRSPITIGQYSRHVREQAAWLRGQGFPDEVHAVSHADLARMLCDPSVAESARGGTKRPSSMNTAKRSLRCFWTYLCAAGLVERNPAALIKPARCGPPPPRRLTVEQQERLLDGLAKAKGDAARRDYALFHLLLATGLRIGSALGVRVEDVDLEQGELRVLVNKNSDPVVLVLGKEIRAHLADWIGVRREGLLFADLYGRVTGIRHANRRLKDWLRALGLPEVSTHGLRHSFAMGLYEKTGDIALVQRALAHRDLSSTMVYAQASTERLRVAIG